MENENSPESISIHAPVKGATDVIVDPFNRYLNFNTRSREGSDLLMCLCRFGMEYFNTRSREGSDQPPHRKLPLHQYFNTRSREGSDEARSE